MKKKKYENYNGLTNLEFNTMIFFLTKCMFIGMGYFIIIDKLNQNSYIAAIIGSILSIIMYLIFNGIYNNKYKLDILHLNKKLFGNSIGSIFNLIISIGFGLLSIILIHNFSVIVDEHFIQETKPMYILILIMIPVYYLNTKKIKIFGRVSLITIYIFAFLYSITIFGNIPNVKLTNILPFNDYTKYEMGYDILMYFIFATVPIFLLTILPIENTNKNNNGIGGVLIGNITLILDFLFIILALTGNVATIFKHPEYHLLRQINFFNIIERIENILALQYIITIYIAISLTIYFIKKFISDTFIKINIKNDILVIIICVSFSLLSMFTLKNSAKAIEFYYKQMPYIFVVTILLPMSLTYIFNKFKSKE